MKTLSNCGKNFCMTKTRYTKQSFVKLKERLRENYQLRDLFSGINSKNNNINNVDGATLYKSGGDRFLSNLNSLLNTAQSAVSNDQRKMHALENFLWTFTRSCSQVVILY